MQFERRFRGRGSGPRGGHGVQGHRNFNGHQAAPATQERTAFVAGLPPDVSEVEIQSFFGELSVRDVRLSRNKATGEARGFAFVEFTDEVSLQQAFAYSGLQLRPGQNPLTVSAAKVRSSADSSQQSVNTMGRGRGRGLLSTPPQRGAFTTRGNAMNNRGRGRSGFAQRGRGPTMGYGGLAGVRACDGDASSGGDFSYQTDSYGRETLTVFNGYDSSSGGGYQSHVQQRNGAVQVAEMSSSCFGCATADPAQGTTCGCSCACCRKAAASWTAQKRHAASTPGLGEDEPSKRRGLPQPSHPWPVPMTVESPYSTQACNASEAYNQEFTPQEDHATMSWTNNGQQSAYTNGASAFPTSQNGWNEQLPPQEPNGFCPQQPSPAEQEYQDLNTANNTPSSTSLHVQSVSLSHATNAATPTLSKAGMNKAAATQHTNAKTTATIEKKGVAGKEAKKK